MKVYPMGKISSTYLSSKTPNEFISLLENNVKEMPLYDMRQAKYFGLLLDSMPDVSHSDQMCQIYSVCPY